MPDDHAGRPGWLSLCNAISPNFPCLSAGKLGEVVGEQVGAYGWQPRVRAKLIALGDPVPDPSAVVGTVGRLTPQELQVVRRAALGMSNREIAAQLFLSPRTVGHHLNKAYPKLGVSRRAELAQLDL